MKRLIAATSFSVAFLAASIMLPQSAFAKEKRCARAAQQAALEKPLPNLSEKVAAGEGIRIIAFGSSSTEGTPDIPKAEIFPNVMAEELSRELATPVELVNKGKGGDTIAKMAARLEQDVLNLKPDLVIWQLGVNDVLTMDGVAPAIDQMREALIRFKARKLPVVLVDLQVSPLVERDRDTPVMQDAIIQAAQAEGVLHFNRFGEMKALIASQSAAMADLVQPDQLHMTRLGHFCTGKLLAQQIARASFGNASFPQ
jgi:acyl-CoA thioesterase I